MAKLVFWNRLESYAAPSIIGANLSKVGTPTFGTGKYGNCYTQADGGGGFSSNFLYIVNPMYGMNKGAIEMWYYFSATPSTGYDTLFDYKSAGNRLFLYRDANANTTYFGLFGANAVGPNLPADTAWHHILILWDSLKAIDGSKSGKILIDGSSVFTTTNSFTNNLPNTEWFQLGGLTNDGTRVQHPLDGGLDNIKIWDDTDVGPNQRFRERGGMKDFQG